MIIGTFVFYFFLFIVFFSLPGIRNKEKSNMLFKFLAIPALFGIVMAFLSVIKVFFLYKLMAVVFFIVTGLLSYWQWGQKIRRWWK